MIHGCDERPAEAWQKPTLLPMRFLGMGLWIVWQWCTHWPATLYVAGYEPASGSAFVVCDAAMRVVDIAAMVALALLWRRLTPLVSCKRLIVAAAASMAVGTAGVLAVANGLVAHTGVACVLSGLAAFGGAVLFLSWAEVYSRLEPNLMLLMGILSLVFAGAVSFVLNYLASPLPLAGTVLVPLASFALCMLSNRYVPPGKASDRLCARHLRVSFPWKPVVVMAFAGFTAGFGNFALFGQTASTRMLATAVVGLCILAVAAVFRRRASLDHIVFASFGVTAAGFVLVALIGVVNPAPAAFLIMVAYIGLCVTGLALLGRLSFVSGVPSLWLFGLGRAASELMMGLGSYARFVPGIEAIPHSGYALAVLSAMSLAGLGFVALLWQGERSQASNWAVDVIDVDSGLRVRSERDAVVHGCVALARSCGLTEREREVLEMLALGSSYQEVCQGLLLSMGTVKTHVRHVYAKMGVHSREEALELILAAEE